MANLITKLGLGLAFTAAAVGVGGCKSAQTQDPVYNLMNQSIKLINPQNMERIEANGLEMYLTEDTMALKEVLEEKNMKLDFGELTAVRYSSGPAIVVKGQGPEKILKIVYAHDDRLGNVTIKLPYGGEVNRVSIRSAGKEQVLEGEECNKYQVLRDETVKRLGKFDSSRN